MNVLEIQKTVGQIVADNYRTAEVFKKYGIDFCCGGKKALDKACADKKVNYNRRTRSRFRQLCFAVRKSCALENGFFGRLY